MFDFSQISLHKRRKINQWIRVKSSNLYQRKTHE